MAEPSSERSRIESIAAALGRLADSTHLALATAESLTGGHLAAALAAQPEAGTWFRGGVVAYQPLVKYSLLDSPPGPVVTAATAASMARAVGELMAADFSVAVTGVGGPASDEGKPAGTVYVATWGRGRDTMSRHARFDGEPVEVLASTIEFALRSLVQRINLTG